MIETRNYISERNNMNRAGQYVLNMPGKAEYYSFRPAKLPPSPELTIDEEIISLIVDANIELAKLETSIDLIPSSDLFISMYVRKEALLSSQIEGTQCTLDDILDPNVDANINADLTDVINYVKAVDFALDGLNKLPVCNRLIRETHSVLMTGTRGQEKNPGEFRKSQNWIGAENCALKDARYIPPNVEDMRKGMDSLEKYINTSVLYDPLVRAALIHYQFETIHPFLDGNGRIGRLLILLYLIEEKIINHPAIYVSYFLKKNQVEYYDRMGEVRRSGNYEQWVKFFLKAVKEAAEDSLHSIKQLSNLHNESIAVIPKTSRKVDNVRAVFDYAEQHPILDISRTAEALGLSYNTVSGAVQKLVQTGVLKKMTNAARNRVFVYENYLDILRKDT